MNLTEEFTRIIEYKILANELSIGEKLLPIRELALQYNVSRSVINAAIINLQTKGYLNIVTRQYIEVANWKKQGTLAVLDGLIANEILDSQLLQNLFDMRMLIECDCVARVSKNKNNKELIDKLSHIIKCEQMSNDLQNQVKYDLAFHQTIVADSDNMIYSMISTSYEKLSTKMIKAFYQSEDVRAFVHDLHNQILEAIKCHDEILAVKLLEKLLLHGEDKTKKLYKGEE